MKILYLSDGNSVYDYRFLAKMVERGHEPYMVSYWPYPVHFDMPGVRFIQADPRLPVRLGPPGRWMRLVRIVLHLRRVLHTIKPDVLHTGYVQTNGFYGALSGFHPVLSMPWGSDILLDPDSSTWNTLVAAFTLKRADKITCDCEVVKGHIIELAGCPRERVVVFPWGVDLQTFHPLPQAGVSVRDELDWQGNEILIMTRKFDKEIYGVEYFLQALPMIIRRRPGARAIMVGDGPLRAKYRALASDLGVEEHLLWAGWADEPQMSAYLNAADVYVTTALSDGTSASLLEAMACGCAVVVSDAPAYSEWVQDGFNGYIVPRQDSETLAQRLIQLLGDAKLRRSIGQRNLEIARDRADWEKNFSILEGIYASIAGGSETGT